MVGGAWSLPNSGFAAGGGEVSMSVGGKTVAGSIGTSSASKMEGFGYALGPGIVASGPTPSSDLDKAHVYPNPFIPSRGHTKATFTQLTSRCTIRVYTLSGELVREFVKDDSTDKMPWAPVVNMGGQPLASGVYLWAIESLEGQVKTGKFMVIK